MEQSPEVSRLTRRPGARTELVQVFSSNGRIFLRSVDSPNRFTFNRNYGLGNFVVLNCPANISTAQSTNTLSLALKCRFAG